jgi:hypothetical protein
VNIESLLQNQSNRSLKHSIMVFLTFRLSKKWLAAERTRIDLIKEYNVRSKQLLTLSNSVAFRTEKAKQGIHKQLKQRLTVKKPTPCVGTICFVSPPDLVSISFTVQEVVEELLRWFFQVEFQILLIGWVLCHI